MRRAVSTRGLQHGKRSCQRVRVRLADQRALNALTALPDDMPELGQGRAACTRAGWNVARAAVACPVRTGACAGAELDTRSYVRLKLDIEVARELPREEGVDRLAILIEEADDAPVRWP